MNNPKYLYSSLKTEREIRLLCLQPGSDEEPLRCTIRHVNIEEKPSYSAISYVWGLPKPSEVLIINEKHSLLITPALFSALKDIRALYCDGQEQVLWADGVCIQQSDLKERAQQVSIMNIIYRQATRVLTYTGPESENSTQALNFIQELGRQIKEWKGGKRDMSFPPPKDPRWTSLHEFFQRTWPSRLWIVQESLLSQCLPILLCGRREVSWNLVLELVLLTHDGHLPFVIRHSDTDSASSLLWLGELRAAACDSDSRKDTTLVQLLRACRVQHCADPRDKIFAVLSVASDTVQLQIRADYSLSKRELYTKVAANIMQKTQSLAVMKSAGYEEQSDLPSWTINRVTVPLDINDFLFEKDTTYTFSAGGQDESCTTIVVNADSGVLSFQGTIIDQISLLTDVVCAKKKTKDHSWMAWFQDTIELFDTRVYGKGEAMEKAFWQTLSGGRTHDRQKATEVYQPQYFAWRDHISIGKGQMLSKSAEQFLRGLRRGIHLRRLCKSSSGYIGLVPRHAEEGDEICVVRGERVPFVLRQAGIFRTFIGECYIHGIMDGEALQLPGSQPQEVRLL